MVNYLKISGEAGFQILAHSFTVSPSESGYVLAYSADGITWTEWSEVTPANETLIVNGVAFGQYIKLLGNTSDVQIIY